MSCYLLVLCFMIASLIFFLDEELAPPFTVGGGVGIVITFILCLVVHYWRRHYLDQSLSVIPAHTIVELSAEELNTSSTFHILSLSVQIRTSRDPIKQHPTVHLTKNLSPSKKLTNGRFFVIRLKLF